jgi:hypothetical protein
LEDFSGFSGRSPSLNFQTAGARDLTGEEWNDDMLK